MSPLNESIDHANAQLLSDLIQSRLHLFLSYLGHLICATKGFHEGSAALAWSSDPIRNFYEQSDLPVYFMFHDLYQETT